MILNLIKKTKKMKNVLKNNKSKRKNKNCPIDKSKVKKNNNLWKNNKMEINVLHSTQSNKPKLKQPNQQKKLWMIASRKSIGKLDPSLQVQDSNSVPTQKDLEML